MTAPFWTLDHLATALDQQLRDGSRPRGTRAVRDISTDTRTLQSGDAFVALVGEHFDGHDFLPQALARGAAALVISRPKRAAHAGVPVYGVHDTLVALGELGHFRRCVWGGTVVGIGGSNGKTTTKDLARAALGSVLAVHATTGNLNNLIGVPLTLLATPDEARVAVVEMGVNVPGEMARLREIVSPDLALVTCIAEEHLEGLGSLDGVMREESILFEDATVAITPAEQPEVGAAAAKRARRVVQAGLDAGDVRADRWGIDAEGLGWIELDGVTVRPPVRGAHNLRNTMLALALALELGVSIEDAARGVAAMAVPAMRSAWQPLGRATLINDAYNASPASMRAALDLLGSTGDGRSRVAVLGEMRELGAHAARLHDEVARYALAQPLALIAATGEMAAALRRVAPVDPRVLVADDVDALWELLAPRLALNAVILLKASRGVKLERLVPLLTAWANG